MIGSTATVPTTVKHGGVDYFKNLSASIQKTCRVRSAILLLRGLEWAFLSSQETQPLAHLHSEFLCGARRGPSPRGPFPYLARINTKRKNSLDICPYGHVIFLPCLAQPRLRMRSMPSPSPVDGRS